MAITLRTMRYTEAKLNKLAEEMLKDIEKTPSNSGIILMVH